jgi:hypothetical protein
MLTALGSIVTQQANPTKNTMIKVKQFLDYAFTHLDAIITYQACDMVLAALMHPNSWKPMLAVKQDDISSCPATHLTPITTVRSSLLPTSSRQSCPWQPRPKSKLSTLTVGKQSLLTTA